MSKTARTPYRRKKTKTKGRASSANSKKHKKEALLKTRLAATHGATNTSASFVAHRTSECSE